MYNLTEKQLLYVTRVAEVNSRVLNLLIKEGVPPEHLIEDWIHRIVTGRTTVEGEEILAKGRPGMGGQRIGAKPAYEKPRTFQTMAEGLAEGYKYDPDITHSVGTYIEGAFNKIAAARFEAYTAEFGATPLERLMQRFPGLAERAALTQTELADAAKFGSVINRAIRGEQIPEATLKAMERRFPELGHRLRYLTIQMTPESEIARNLIKVREYPTKFGTLPSEQKIREALSLMDFDERLTYRSIFEDLAITKADAGAKRILRILDDIDIHPEFIPKDSNRQRLIRLS